MKTTRFLKKCYGDNEELLLLNTYTGDLLKINKQESKDWEYILSNPDIDIFPKIKKLLTSKDFLVGNNIDESARAELKYYEIAHSSNKLLLTILPTEDCNFRCQYCYEEHNIGKMKSETTNRIKKFVEANLIKYDMLQVNWFGGEPLEATDIIIELSNFFIEICAKQKKPYRSSITTNGYNLNAKLLQKLYSLHIVDYQITLDGVEETHNLSRPHKEGMNSFTQIKSNLLSIRDNIKTKNISIVIRTNISKSVMNNIDEHIDFLNKEFGNDSRFGVIFKIAWSNGKNTEYNKQELLPTGDLFNVLHKCIGKKMNFTFNRGQICAHHGICYAAHANAFVFGSDGKVYKCTVEFDKDINKIGYISENGQLIIDKDKLAFWITKTPFKEEFEKCTSCFFQPACMSISCPLNRFDEKGNHQCTGMKNYVDIYMKLCAQSSIMVTEVSANE